MIIWHSMHLWMWPARICSLVIRMRKARSSIACSEKTSFAGGRSADNCAEQSRDFDSSDQGLRPWSRSCCAWRGDQRICHQYCRRSFWWAIISSILSKHIMLQNNISCFSEIPSSLNPFCSLNYQKILLNASCRGFSNICRCSWSWSCVHIFPPQHPWRSFGSSCRRSCWICSPAQSSSEARRCQGKAHKGGDQFCTGRGFKTESMPPCLEFEFYKMFYKISVFWKADSTLNSALQDLEEKLIKELNEAVDKCVRDVNAFMEPLQRHSEGIVARIEDLQQREGTLMEELSEIQQQAANIEWQEPLYQG